MAVPFKNVTVSVAPYTQSAISASTVLDNAGIGTAITGIRGYLEEQDAQEFYYDYGVQLEHPALLQVEIVDAIKLKGLGAGGGLNAPQDCEVTVTASSGKGALIGNVYKIQGRGDIHDDGLQSDHASYILNRMSQPQSA